MKACPSSLGLSGSLFFLSLSLALALALSLSLSLSLSFSLYISLFLSFSLSLAGSLCLASLPPTALDHTQKVQSAPNQNPTVGSGMNLQTPSPCARPAQERTRPAGRFYLVGLTHTGVPRSYETPTPLESPQVPRHRATVRSYGGRIPYERGTPAQEGTSGSAPRRCRATCDPCPNPYREAYVGAGQYGKAYVGTGRYTCTERHTGRYK